MQSHPRPLGLTALVISTLLLVTSLSSQAKSTRQQPVDPELFSEAEFRSIGPFRGGRSAAVTGVSSQPNTFYMGTTGGGVWRSNDSGGHWTNISDGFFGGSIGAVAVSEWDPNVIYVGGGEKTVRGNVSHGYGMWKSEDQGKTWRSIGLKDTRHISRVRIHPKNPDVVYAAAMGHLYGPNKQRGIFRSEDGGNSWKKVLFVDEEVGFVDLAMDPNNARVLYASSWRVKRTPYSLESGGEGSGLWKSTDGGNTWINLSSQKGFPGGTLGIIGVTVSPVDSERVWAMVEANDGGLYRSDNGGKSWRRINQERKLRQRAWYYTRLYAHPSEIDTVFVLNVRFWKSKDGGSSFSSIRTPHGDHHDLWINPTEPNVMVIGDDGGAQVTRDGGDSFSTYMNQPTAQFYRVTTDNHFPYRIYGAQQDNSTVRIMSRTAGYQIGESDWEPTAGGESGHLAPNPDNPEIVYGGSYDGFLTRVDHRIDSTRLIDVWPDNPMGKGAADLKYRFQWNFPIFFSPHDSKILYTAANHLFRSTDEGQSWQQISPDLTRDDKSKQGSSGGPITKDNTSVEYYSTIFAAAESIHEPGVLWTGSDDGLVYISRDNGETWKDVTPSGLPDWTQINSVEIDPFNKGGLYIAGTRYKSDDFKPYLYKTENYGKSWKKITRGINDEHFTRVIRADKTRQGLLWAGTESGLYMSLDDGKNWQAFQQNLPIVPITDIALKNNDVIIATQGRSFWVLDNVNWLHQFTQKDDQQTLKLYTPTLTHRLAGGVNPNPENAGVNPPNGVLFDFVLNSTPKNNDKSDNSSEEQPLVLTISDQQGKQIKRFTSDAKLAGERISAKKGYNRFVWNMRYADAKDFKGMIVWAGNTRGPLVAPGSYQAEITYGKQQQKVSFTIEKDPRISTTQAEFDQQLAYLLDVHNKINDVTGAITQIRELYKGIKQVTAPLAEQKEQYQSLLDAGKALHNELKTIEEALYQTKNQSRQDPLNFPGRLLNSLMGLKSQVQVGDYPPTNQAVQLKQEIFNKIDEQLAKLAMIKQSQVDAFNQLVAEQKLPALTVN